MTLASTTDNYSDSMADWSGPEYTDQFAFVFHLKLQLLPSLRAWWHELCEIDILLYRFGNRLGTLVNSTCSGKVPGSLVLFNTNKFTFKRRTVPGGKRRRIMLTSPSGCKHLGRPGSGSRHEGLSPEQAARPPGQQTSPFFTLRGAQGSKWLSLQSLFKMK